MGGYKKLNQQVKKAFANIAASQTDSALVTAVTGKVIRVIGFMLRAGGTTTDVTFNKKPSGSGTAISPLFASGVNSGVVGPLMPREYVEDVGYFETTISQGLTVTTGAGSTVGVEVFYIEV